MKSYKLSELSHAEVESLKARPCIDFSSIFGMIQPIVDDVCSRGDAAVKAYTEKFDKVKLQKIVENVSELPCPEPAQVAGCKSVVLATPPCHDGSICKEVLSWCQEGRFDSFLKLVELWAESMKDMLTHLAFETAILSLFYQVLTFIF